MKWPTSHIADEKVLGLSFFVFCTHLTSEVRFRWGLVCMMRLWFVRITPTSRGHIFPARRNSHPPSRRPISRGKSIENGSIHRTSAARCGQEAKALEMWGCYFAVARRVHRKIVAWKLEGLWPQGAYLSSPRRQVVPIAD